MDAKRWARIENTYQEALERKGDERRAYLDSACHGDDDLRGEVESLLAQVGEEVLIDSPVWRVAADLLDDNPAVESGTRIGPYEVDVLIGAGGMGQVYRARDTTLQRDVALKVLPAAFTTDSERLARFKREAQILASLNHPNIAGVYGFQTSGSVHALVLELVDGPTLADRIAAGPLPLDDALVIASQIADALEAAHECGIVHRDLKPANIKLRSDGTVKILDFGLAKALEPEAAVAVERRSQPVTASPTVLSPVMTGAGTILGTAAYMAPEQAKGKGADRRSDIWAFGCVLYEMLTGRRPFDGEDATDTLAHVLRGDPDWTALPAVVPAPITNLIKRCLEKQPRNRVSHIAVAAFAIGESNKQPPPIATSAAASIPSRRRRAAWIVGAALLVAASAFAVFWSPRRQPPMRQLRLELTTPPSVSPNSLELAPDGRAIAFVADDEGQSRLWIRALDTGSVRAMRGTEGARFPFWSPDSRSVGFFAGEQLKVLNVGDRTVRALARAPAPQGGTWNREGTIVFAPSSPGGLWRIAADGGTPSQVTELIAGQRAHAFPQFLPDGRRFLYQVAGTPDTAGIHVDSLDSSDAKRIAYLGGAPTALDTVSNRLLFVREGTLLAQQFDPARLELTGTPAVVAEGVNGQSLTTSATGLLAYRQASAPAEYRFVWVDRAGMPLQRLGDPTRGGGDFSLSRDGRIAFSAPVTVPGDQDVHVLDVERGTRDRLTTNPTDDRNPLWSPAGDRIVFTRASDPGTTALVLRRTTGDGKEEVLLTSRRGPVATDWSRDGLLLFKQRSSDEPTSRLTSESQVGWEIWAMRTEGDRTPFPIVRNSSDNRDALFSPDGQWIAYHSNETGQFEIHIQPFPSGTRRRVSTAGGVQARWRSDGKELFYVALDGALMAVPVRPLPGKKSVDVSPASPLFQTPLAGGVIQPINRQQYTPAPDGSRFLLHALAGVPPNMPIEVIVNFNERTEP